MQKIGILILATLLITACSSNSSKKSEEYIRERVDVIYARYHRPQQDEKSGRVTDHDINYDELYCSARYKALLSKALDLAGDNDLVIDYDHWTSSQDDSDFTYQIKKVSEITDSTAVVELSTKNFGEEGSIILKLYFERDDWFVDDFVTEDGTNSEKAYLQQYVSDAL
jgi:ABC-type oligopeptide transport system substrate-binding subunit